MEGGVHGVEGLGVFEARIKQIAALNLVSRPGRKSLNLDAWGGGGGVFEARIQQIAALKWLYNPLHLLSQWLHKIV